VSLRSILTTISFKRTAAPASESTAHAEPHPATSGHDAVDPYGFPVALPASPGIQDDFNRKGLVSDQGEKKQTFYILQNACANHTVGEP
jgi:hypothetical protein